MADPVVTTLTSGSSSLATTTVSFSAQTAGTLLLLQVQSDDYKTGNPSGWSLATSGQDFLGHYLFYKFASGSETSVAYTIGSASVSSYQLATATNIDSTAGLGVTSSLHTHGGANTGTTAVTPTSGSRWIVFGSLAGMHSGSSSLSPAAAVTNSYTIQSSVTGSGAPTEVGMLTYLVLNGGTATSTATSGTGWNTNSPSCSYGLLAAFKVAAGGGGVSGDAALAATGTLTATGTVGKVGAASLAATSTGTATGTVGKVSGSSLAATATQTATGTVGKVGDATLAATATLTATGTVSAAGVSSGASLAVTGTLTAAGVVGKASGASLAVTATQTAAGTVGKVSGASLAVTGTLTGAGTVGESSGASLAVTATLTAAGVVTTGPSSGASLAATAALSATGTVGKVTGASLVVTDALTATGTVGKVTGASLAATVTLTASGTVTAAGVSSGAALVETVTLAATGRVGTSSGASQVFMVTLTASGFVQGLYTPDPSRFAIIPAEPRLAVIPAESRSALIPPETRRWTLMSENVWKHSPTAKLDYSWPWTDWLAAGETITSFTITVPAGVTLTGDIEAGGVITGWIVAPVGPKIELVCHIVTSAGREDDRTITLLVGSR